MPPNEMGRSAPARSEYPSPGEIERLVTRLRHPANGRSWLILTAADTIEALSQRGRDEAIEEAAKVVETVHGGGTAWDPYASVRHSFATAIRSLLSREKGSRA